jgi:hypothetical protein
MNIDALVPELWRRYPFLDDESLPVRLGGIRETDVAAWAADCGGQRARVYDEIARYVAVAFHEGRLPFAFCDAVMNDLEAVLADADDTRPNLFLQVFFAFDAGEYHRRDDKLDDPVVELTAPAIAEIVRGF